MKLPPKQQEIVDLLKTNEWKMGSSNPISSDATRYWLQKPALCCGGESKEVNTNTAKALIKKGVLVLEKKRAEDAYWLSRWTLNPTMLDSTFDPINSVKNLNIEGLTYDPKHAIFSYKEGKREILFSKLTSELIKKIRNKKMFPQPE